MTWPPQPLSPASVSRLANAWKQVLAEVADGKCEITCSLGRRLEEQALQEGAQEAETSAAIVDGFLSRRSSIAAKLNKEDVHALKQELGQDFGLPALA